jgi:hypothetical protein
MDGWQKMLIVRQFLQSHGRTKRASIETEFFGLLAGQSP